MRAHSWIVVVAFAAAACGTSSNPADAGGTDSGSPADSGTGNDGGSCPDAGQDTWCNYVQGFFTTYCDSCHTPGGQGDPSGANLDFTMFTDVQANALTIRCGVAETQDPSWSCTVPAHQFPIGSGPFPSNADRSRIVAWVDAGTPQ